MGRVDVLCDELRARHERVTLPRRLVIETLVESADHLTADQVLERVQVTNPDIHRATIYRTLDTFTRLGLTEHTHLGHGPAVYHLTDDTHQHLVCEVCGKVTEVPASLLRGVERAVLADYGFVMRPLHFAMVGRCRRCARRATSTVSS